MKIQKEHLAEIERHLKADCWLGHEDFIQEMTDHYACALEEKQNEGIAWKEAIEEIDKVFGGRYGLETMEKAYKKQIQILAGKKLRSLLKSYILSFPNNILTLCLLAGFYLIFANHIVEKNQVLHFIALPLYSISLIALSMVGFRHFFTLKNNQNMNSILLINTSLFTMNTGSIRMIIKYLPENYSPIVASMSATLMIVAVLVCSQIIYDTYPRLKKKQIA